VDRCSSVKIELKSHRILSGDVLSQKITTLLVSPSSCCENLRLGAVVKLLGIYLKYYIDYILRNNLVLTHDRNRYITNPGATDALLRERLTAILPGEAPATSADSPDLPPSPPRRPNPPHPPHLRNPKPRLTHLRIPMPRQLRNLPRRRRTNLPP
jgi:hypothetical protein